MDLGIAGHVAPVTGGARGIGAAICELLAGEGCRLVVCDRDLDAAEDLAVKLRARGTDGAHRGFPGRRRRRFHDGRYD